MKNIYLLDLKKCGYDEYDAWVVIADDEEEVKRLCNIRKEKELEKNKEKRERGEWLYREDNQYEDNIDSIKLIGTTEEIESKIVLGSYNAG